jgi:chitodextrinase
MRILDQNDNEIQPEDVDYRLGKLSDDKIFIQHHDAVEAVEEQGHYETLQEYPNGGKDVKWKVDVLGVEAKEAWDEYEDIQRYTKFTAEELKANAEREAQALKQQEIQKAVMAAVPMLIQPMLTSMPVEDLKAVSALVPEWTVGTEYKTGDIVRYKGVLYRCLQNDTAQEIFPPDTYISGWKCVDEPDEHGIHPFSQPLGATDTYMKGDKVSFEGAYYQSNIDYNVWSPTAYPQGWTKLDGTGESPEPGGDDDEYPAFVQPTGAHDAYNIGDKVTYNGHRYECTMNNNAYSPDAYPQGWKQID